MSSSVRVEHIRDGERRFEQTEMRGVIILDQSGVKASCGKTWQIGAEQEHHREWGKRDEFDTFIAAIDKITIHKEIKLTRY